jgi:hypothetical protein
MSEICKTVSWSNYLTYRFYYGIIDRVYFMYFLHKKISKNLICKIPVVSLRKIPEDI